MKFHYKPVIAILVVFMIFMGAGAAILAPISDPRWFVWTFIWCIIQFGFLMPNMEKLRKWGDDAFES